MNAEDFIAQYTPTRFMQATEIFWHPVSRQSETVKITVWDVVDKAIQTNPEVKRTKELPDASTVDTISRADGVIVLYDPRVEESIYYALDVVDRTPRDKPLIILANFSDEIQDPSDVHPLMRECATTRFHLAASMKMNTGLAELATWLDLPLNTSLAEMYKLHLDESERVVKELMQELNQTGFTDPEAVLEKELEEAEEAEVGMSRSENVSEEENVSLPTVTQPVNEASFFSGSDDEEDMEAFLKAHPNAKINLEVLKKTTEEEERRERKVKTVKVLAKKEPAKIVIRPAEKKPIEEKAVEEKETPPVQEVQPEIPTLDVGNGQDDFFGDDTESDMGLEHVEEEEEPVRKEKKSKVLPKVMPNPAVVIPEIAPEQEKPVETNVTEPAPADFDIPEEVLDDFFGQDMGSVSVQEPKADKAQEVSIEPVKDNIDSQFAVASDTNIKEDFKDYDESGLA